MSREELLEQSMKKINKIINTPDIQALHHGKSLTTLMMDYMQGQVREQV